MHKHVLRELAKFFSGLIVGDFLVGVWVASMKIGSVTFLGISFNQNMITAWMFFDVILFVLLVHYGWRANIISPSITEKKVFKIVGWVFGAVALAHLLRIALGVSIVIGGFPIPFWISWIGFIVATYLSYASFHFVSSAKRKK